MPCGYVYVDGDSVGELTDDELEKRRILGTEGFVSAFVVVDTDNHEVVTGPKIYLMPWPRTKASSTRFVTRSSNSSTTR